ncbi:adenylate kinase family protein [[Eubacterium] cellulosolvens]
MRRNARHIVITGTPGVGKTRFARILGHKIKASVVNLSRFVKEKKFISSIDKQRRTEIINIKRTSKALNELIKERADDVLIFEGHFAQLVVDPQDIKIAFVLRCHPETLRKRLRNRGFSKEKIYENVLSEILDSCLVETLQLLGKKRVYELDTTKLDPERLSTIALEAIKGKRASNIGIVDWIEQLEKRGTLIKYISKS